MRAVDDEIETIHLYVVREQEKRPYTAFPLFCAFLCLMAIAGITAYSATHPSYEHERLRVPAAFTVDGAATDSAIYVPGATANGFGVTTVAAHLLIPGTNLPTLAINEVVGASLFIRNLSPFIGSRPAYSVKYITPQDQQTALSYARQSVDIQKSHIIGYLARPCSENLITTASKIAFSLFCQFATYKVPSYMRIQSAKLVGTQFFVDVVFVARPRPVQFDRK